MNFLKFTFKLPEPHIPEVSEEFKEFMKRRFTPMYFNYDAPIISFEEFKEVLSRNRTNGDSTPSEKLFKNESNN